MREVSWPPPVSNVGSGAVEKLSSRAIRVSGGRLGKGPRVKEDLTLWIADLFSATKWGDVDRISPEVKPTRSSRLHTLRGKFQSA